MKKILFTALTVGSSMAEVAHSHTKLSTSWDEPSSHELIGAKAEDVYYFDDIGNMLGHFGQEAKAERIRHVAGMDVDTEVPAAKMITSDSLAEASSTNDKDKGADAAADDEQDPSVEAARTPEEKVARVAVTGTDKYKRSALKAAKEAAVSKSVASRATENAHAF